MALMLGGGMGGVALTGEAQRAEVQGDVSQPSLSRQGISNPLASLSSSSQSLTPPDNAAAPPQAPVAGPEVLAAHMAPPPPCIEDPSHPLFCVYTVESGDTLSGIAQRFQLQGNAFLSAVEMLAQSNKPDVVSSDQIVPGQKLRLPKQTGILVTVLVAKPLGEIAASYGVSADAIATANGISEVRIGQDILIPDPQHLPSASPVAAVPTVVPEPEEEETEEPPAIETPVPTATPQPTSTPRPNVTPTRTPRTTATAKPSATPTARPDRPGNQSKYGFIWPVWGEISSYFGPSHPLGIDIDLYHDPNAPIAAAKKGIVSFAGGNACCSYGLYVVVDHGDGTQTLYGHLSRIAVVQGQMVGQGELLGYGGRTGYATGNHLHFEIHVGDAVVDPLLFLP